VIRSLSGVLLLFNRPDRSFLAWTGLTSELHQPDRCRGLLWKFSSFASRDRSDRCRSIVLELLFRYVLESVKVVVGS
jgi:hypothetical protein